MNFSHRKRPPLEITLTPMIDVVFLLLIFFMITTTFNQHTELAINLPQARGVQNKATEKRVTLTINAQGIYFVAGTDGVSRRLDNQQIADLKRALVQAAGNARSTPFIISADSEAPYQAIVTALDVASRLGFSRIIFSTKNITRPAP